MIKFNWIKIFQTRKKYKVYVSGEYIGKIVLENNYAFSYWGYWWKSVLDSKYHQIIRKVKLLKLEKYNFIRKEINKRWLIFNTLENNYDIFTVDYSDLELYYDNSIHFSDHSVLYSANGYYELKKTRKQAKNLLKCVYQLDKLLTKWYDIII